MIVPNEVINAERVLSKFLFENNLTEMEVGRLHVSSRTAEVDYQLRLAQQIKECSDEVGKIKYEASIAESMYDGVGNMKFEPDYSTDGQFTGGYRVECYTAENKLMFFDLEDNYVHSATEVNREAWLRWRDKNKFVLQICS